jgi:hypothetical protein
MRVEWTDIVALKWSKIRSVLLFNGKVWQETGDVVKTHRWAPTFRRKFLFPSSVYCVNGCSIFYKKLSIIYQSTAYYVTHNHNFLFGSFPSLQWKLNPTLHTDFNIPYVSDVIHERLNKHHNKLEAHPNPLLQPLLQPINTRRLKRCWPLDL